MTSLQIETSTNQILLSPKDSVTSISPSTLSENTSESSLFASTPTNFSSSPTSSTSLISSDFMSPSFSEDSTPFPKQEKTFNSALKTSQKASINHVSHLSGDFNDESKDSSLLEVNAAQNSFPTLGQEISEENSQHFVDKENYFDQESAFDHPVDINEFVGKPNSKKLNISQLNQEKVWRLKSLQPLQSLSMRNTQNLVLPKVQPFQEVVNISENNENNSTHLNLDNHSESTEDSENQKEDNIISSNIVTGRPRSKSKKKLGKLNLSIVVPPTEQAEEFRQGSLVITKEGIKHFEASPLENRVWPEEEKKLAIIGNNGSVHVESSIQLKDLIFIKELGRGASSVVSLVEHKPTGRRYAMKTLVMDSESISPNMIYDEIEALVLARNSSYTVNLVQAYYDKKQIHMLLDYVDGNSLEQLLMKRHQLPDYILSVIARQILVALQFLHPKIMHMDIKPANILISGTGKIYIADFGTMVKQKKLQDPEAAQKYSELGTVLFWPPERAQNLPFDYRSDIWNLGITLFVLRVGKLPFSYTNATTHFQIRDMIEQLDIEKILKENSQYIIPEFADFLEKCLQKDPNNRPSANELLNHPYILNYEHSWTQNAGQDRVSNFLQMQDYENFQRTEKHNKKESEEFSITRDQEIIKRAQQSRESSPTEYGDVFSPTTSLPRNTNNYFEMYNDNQETLDQEPTSFNSRIKKKHYNRKSNLNYTPTTQAKQNDKSASAEKSWKSTSYKTKMKISSVHKRASSFDVHFNSLMENNFKNSFNNNNAQTDDNLNFGKKYSHFDSPNIFDSPASYTSSIPGAKDLSQEFEDISSSSNTESLSSPITPVTRKKYLNKILDFVTEHLLLDDLHSNKVSSKLKKMIKSNGISKEDQKTINTYIKECENALNPSSWSEEKKFVNSPHPKENIKQQLLSQIREDFHQKLTINTAHYIIIN